MKKRIRTIGFKMSVLFTLFSLILCLGLTLFSYITSMNSYKEIYSTHAQQTSQLVATMIDGDKIGAYLITMEKDAYYEELHQTLNDVKREMGLIYLYIFEPHADHFVYIMEAYLDTDDMDMISSIGETFEYTYLEREFLVPDILAQCASTDIVFSPNVAGFGSGISAWAPIFNSDGEMTAMVEVDFPFSRVEETLSNFLVTIVLLSCGITLLLVVGLFTLMRRMISRPLKKLSANVSGFASSEELASYVDDIKTGDEMQILSEAFGKMAKDIDRYTRNLASVAADRERIATELDLATDIQTSLLPRDFPAFPDRDDFDLYALTEPAKEVGGNFYDFFLITPTELCVVVADVSGRGIPAALFMVVAKTMIKNQIMAGMPVNEAMAILNTRLFGTSSANMTVSAFVGVLDVESGKFTYVNAGQKTPLIMRNGGAYEWLKTQAASSLAQSKNVAYRAQEVTLRQNDRIFLYTDGVSSAINADGEMWGKKRLCSALNAGRIKNPPIQELICRLKNEIEAFEDGAERHDDITMLVLEYQKGDKVQAEIAVPAGTSSFQTIQAFLKRQLSENGLGGAFYARLSVVVEELFVIAVTYAERNDILIRCRVSGDPKQVEVRLSYAGKERNPLELQCGANADSLLFVNNHVDMLTYAYVGARNAIIMRMGYKKDM